MRLVEAATAQTKGKKGQLSHHYDVAVYKVPKGRRRQATTTRPGLHGPGTTGFVQIDSESLKPRRGESGHAQTTALHESGHMLGLGEEYEGASGSAHAGAVRREAGVEVELEDDGRLMAVGDQIQGYYSVPFLAGLRAATRMAEWGLSPKSPRAVPHRPEDVNDLPAPVTPQGTAVA